MQSRIYLGLLLSLVAPLAAGQGSNDLNLGLAAIRAHFDQSRLVPDLLANFEPRCLLNVNYNGAGNISPGQRFTPEEVGTEPALSVQCPSTSSDSFTLVMLDADVVGAQLNPGPNRHILENNITVSSDSTVSNATAVAITRYFGPGPAAGSGPHRYAILLYEQPSSFTPPTGFSETGMGVEPMDWNAYVQDSRLGSLVAGNYIQVEAGTASASVSPTSAVVSSTLSVPSTGSSTSASSAATGTGSTNQSGGNNNSAGRGVASCTPFILALTGVMVALL